MCQQSAESCQQTAVGCQQTAESCKQSAESWQQTAESCQQTAVNCKQIAAEPLSLAKLAKKNLVQNHYIFSSHSSENQDKNTVRKKSCKMWCEECFLISHIWAALR